MRDVTALHPEVQALVDKLLKACASQGLLIKITDCVRTKAEQDALYAKGRTVAGKIVTNAKYPQSNHCWGIAFDFCRADGSGAYNDSDGFFAKVGAVGKSLGLKWGGDFTSIKDKPHFQFTKHGEWRTLQSKYGTPQAFLSSFSAKAENVTPTTETAQIVRKYKLGDMVRFNTCYMWPSDPASKHMVSPAAVGTITRVLAEAVNNPYEIDTNRCWVNDGDIYERYNKVVARTTGTGVRLRKSPDGTIIGSFKKGTFVDVLDSYTNGWSRIRSGDTIGFVSSQHLSNLQPSKVY